MPDQPASDDPARGPGRDPDSLVTIASPLPFLFAEERHADQQAREALFLTFNADLGFFERAILGVTQATGARTTVVGDGRMSAPDPRAARNAGTRYLHGVAVTPTGAAFHPKVTVVAGAERAIVAIGSGNLSAGGWHLNKETWTVATADRDHCPAIVPQVAEWLRTLPAVCTITPQAVLGITRTAASLEQLAGASSIVDTGHQLAHSSTQPVIDQLPRRPIRQLLLYAPFHDEQALAIRQLIMRLAPAEVILAVQSNGRTVIQPQAIAQVISDLAVPLHVIEDSATAYRHGKLIEGVSADGSRWALTGSPNLSRSALLLEAGRGGNIEAGIIASLPASLFPAGKPTSLDAVPARRIDRAADQPALGVLLIAGARSDAGLHVVFARPTGQPVRVLVSSHTRFDAWTPAGQVPAGVAEHLFPGADAPAGSRICAEWNTISGPVRGAIIFVSDPALVLRRHGESPNRTRAAASDPMNLITDPRLMEIWAASLAQLAGTRRMTAVPRTTGSGAPRGESESPHHGAGLRTDTDSDHWLAYLDDANARLGSSVVQLALGGIPALRAWSPAAGAGLEEPADRIIDERQPGFDADDAGTLSEDPGPLAADVAAAPAETETVAGGDTTEGAAAGARQQDQREGIPDQSGQLEGEKRRGRRTLSRAATDYAPHLPAIDRLAIVKLVLCAIEARIWTDALGDDGWLNVLGTALRNLAGGDIPRQLERHAASLAALAIYMMHEYRPTTTRTAEALLYEEVARQTAHLYSEADPALVADYAEPFTNSNGYPVDPDAVMHVVSVIVQDDPLIEAAEVLETRHPAWQVSKIGDALLLLQGDIRSPFLAAAEALDTIHGLDPVAVRATRESADWAIAARDGSSLIRVESQRGRLTWRHYRLSSLISPSGIARDQDLAGRVRISHGPLGQAFAEALQILGATGVDLDDGEVLPPLRVE